jgi:hypothetical protein
LKLFGFLFIIIAFAKEAFITIDDVVVIVAVAIIATALGKYSHY